MTLAPSADSVKLQPALERMQAMQFFEAIDRRRSVRAYAKQALVQDQIERILAAARLAPSAGDLQSYRIALIDRRRAKEALAAAAFAQDFIAEAPLVLVFCADPGVSEGKYGRRGAELYCVQDATIAACYAQLAATALGLASCWVGAFDEARVAGALRLEAGLRPVAILPIGHAAESPDRPPRRPLDETVWREA
jgi:nitroreductase